jgi:hypothetical protein
VTQPHREARCTLQEVTLEVSSQEGCPLFTAGQKMVVRLPEVDTQSGPVCVYALAQALPLLSAAVRSRQLASEVLPSFRCIAGGERHAEFTVHCVGMVETRESGAARVLRQASFLEELETPLLEKVVSLLHTDEYFPRTMLMEQGGRSDRMVIVNRGRVEIVMLEETGFERTLGHLKEGDLFGATEMVMGVPTRASLRCETVVQASILLRRDLNQLMAREPRIADHLRGFGF